MEARKIVDLIINALNIIGKYQVSFEIADIHPAGAICYWNERKILVDKRLDFFRILVMIVHESKHMDDYWKKYLEGMPETRKEGLEVCLQSEDDAYNLQNQYYQSISVKDFIKVLISKLLHKQDPGYERYWGYMNNPEVVMSRAYYRKAINEQIATQMGERLTEDE